MCSLFESTHVDHENTLDKARKLADCLQYSYVQLVLLFIALLLICITQENMLLMIDLFPDNLIGWPVSAHRNLLAILVEVILGWQKLPNWDKNQVWIQEDSDWLIDCVNVWWRVSSSNEQYMRHTTP